MTSRTLSNKQIKSLDFQIDHLYKSIRKTVDTQSYLDVVWNEQLFSGFGESLRIVTNYSLFMDWHRDTQRTQVFDKYLLHYAIGKDPASILEKQIKIKQFGREIDPIETDVTTETLKQAIDDYKMPYKKIRSIAISLAEAKDFTGIVSALGYVREKYKGL